MATADKPGASQPSLQEQIKAQGEVVRKLKKDKAPPDEVNAPNGQTSVGKVGGVA